MKQIHQDRRTHELTLAQLTELMRGAGASAISCKPLAPNDNSKNQVYLGGDFSALQAIPSGELEASESTSDKPGAGDRKQIYKTGVRFFWIDPEGAQFGAPATQLILYPQYPEVRLSGFLRGAASGPGSLLDPKLEGRDPDRALYLGVCDDGRVLGLVSPPGSVLSRSARSLPEPPGSGTLRPVSPHTGIDPCDALLRALGRIHRAGWIDSAQQNAVGQRTRCSGPRCVGHTLEAELGIIPNGRSVPDFGEWEIKAFTVNDFWRLFHRALTLMTPEPDGGFYRREGVRQFVRRFGRPAKSKPQTLYFTGAHRVGRRCDRTGLTLTLRGYDPGRGRISDMEGGVELVTASGDVAASWSFGKLLEHWRRKHSRVACVPANRRIDPTRPGDTMQSRYGSRVHLGVGTEFSQLLFAIAEGVVLLDPASKVDTTPSGGTPVKARGQFRVSFAYVATLYRQFEEVAVR